MKEFFCVKEVLNECVQNNPHHCIHNHYNTVWEHTALVIEAAKGFGNRLLEVVALLHDAGKPEAKVWNEAKKCDQFIGHADVSRRIAEEILNKEDFGFTNEEKEAILTLIETHEAVGGKKAIRKYYNRYGDYMTRLHLIFRYCDIQGQNPEFAGSKMTELEDAWKFYDELSEAEI